MAENNASWKRPLHLKRDTLMAAASIYQAMYGQENPNEPGQTSIPATFQIVYFIGEGAWYDLIFFQNLKWFSSIFSSTRYRNWRSLMSIIGNFIDSYDWYIDKVFDWFPIDPQVGNRTKVKRNQPREDPLTFLSKTSTKFSLLTKWTN